MGHAQEVLHWLGCLGLSLLMLPALPFQPAEGSSEGDWGHQRVTAYNNISWKDRQIPSHSWSEGTPLECFSFVTWDPLWTGKSNTVASRLHLPSLTVPLCCPITSSTRVAQFLVTSVLSVCGPNVRDYAAAVPLSGVSYKRHMLSRELVSFREDVVYCPDPPPPPPLSRPS